MHCHCFSSLFKKGGYRSRGWGERGKPSRDGCRSEIGPCDDIWGRRAVCPPADGWEGPLRCTEVDGRAACPQVVGTGCSRGPCLMRVVSSCTRLKASRSSFSRRVILSTAWITVVWSRPPKRAPILGRELSVSSRREVHGHLPRDRRCPGCACRCAGRRRSRWKVSADGRLDLLDRDRPGGALREEIPQHLLGDLGRDRPAGQGGVGDDARQRALELADVGRDAVGDEGQHLAGRRSGCRRSSPACAGSRCASPGRAAGRP